MKPALGSTTRTPWTARPAGVAVFQWPDGREHRWLTREYGCFGPRRPDDRSGKPFTLKKGESITQRAGVLVHRGDVSSGRVRERYEAYVERAVNEPAEPVRGRFSEACQPRRPAVRLTE